MKRLRQTEYPVVALTHPGMKGKNNEDCFGVAAFSQGWLGARPILLAVLSDGIGGHRAGEVASAVAVEKISQEVQNSDGSRPAEVLVKAVQAASEAIREQASQKPDHSGMGATCACVWISGDQFYTATVGDSRLYLLRGGKIQRLSTDHTWVQEAVERGVIKPEQVSGHPNAHVIRRYLGSPMPPEVDLRMRLAADEDDARALANQGAKVQPGDLLILTSDGLTDLVTDEEICQAFLNRPGEEAGRGLIDLANERGGHDNITIVAVQVPAAGKPRRAAGAAGSRRWAWMGCGAILLTALLTLSLAGGWWWLNSRPQTTVVLTPSATVSLEQQVLIASPTPTARATRTPGPVSGFRTPTATPAVLLPADSGPTLTAWPTNTPGKK
jgi:serine/threonine protein phosphatase PrpC